MSMQGKPTLGDLELEWHNVKTNADGIVALLIREYKKTLKQYDIEFKKLQEENKKLTELLDTKVKKDDPKK